MRVKATSFCVLFVLAASAAVLSFSRPQDPDQEDVRGAFLTAKPPSVSGLQTNRAQQGTDFSFPSGSDNWLTLDSKPGTENYTFIFSPTPLTAPQFLSEEATSRPLTATERGELTDFLAQHHTNSPATESGGANGTAPFVAVKVPLSVPSGEPLILNVRILHQ